MPPQEGLLEQVQRHERELDHLRDAQAALAERLHWIEIQQQMQGIVIQRLQRRGER